MASGQEELSITIPPEIITDILYRLPAKSIGRFRCVSKSWLSQLTHPNFIKIHLNNNTFTHQNHLIFKTIIEKGSLFLHSLPFHSREVVALPTKFDLQLNSNPSFVEFCGSCDGLVLVRVRYAAQLSEKIVVINPTTRECLHLPYEYYHNVYDTYNNEYVCLGSLYGFGYDSVTDDYKVVALTHYCYVSHNDEYCALVYVYVYSLRNKTMKRLNYSPRSYASTYGVFFNGFIHWIVSTMDDDDLRGIVAFSLADERFSKVRFPNVTDTLKGKDCQLLVLGGKLGIFIKSEGVVWLMNEYGVRESWTKILLHGVDKIPILEPKHDTEPSVFDDNGKILVAYGDRMMVYEVEKAAFTETVCVWNPEMFFLAGLCVESLVSPKLGKDKDDDDSAEDESEEDTQKMKVKKMTQKMKMKKILRRVLKRICFPVTKTCIRRGKPCLEQAAAPYSSRGRE